MPTRKIDAQLDELRVLAEAGVGEPIRSDLQDKFSLRFVDAVRAAPQNRAGGTWQRLDVTGGQEIVESELRDEVSSRAVDGNDIASVTGVVPVVERDKKFSVVGDERRDRSHLVHER